MTEKVRVLVVDDSSFFRKRIRHALERTGEVEIAGEAANGREAVQMAARLRPNLITMDVAMPLMDGISAVREIMRDSPTDIIMFSALTREGAKSTLDALDAGAVDFLAKEDGLCDPSHPGKDDTLCHRVITLARRQRARRPASSAGPLPHVAHATPSTDADPQRGWRPRLVLIGASTGGPVAIQRVIAKLPADYPYPVVTVVHMPREFTSTFAERLDGACEIKVRLAVDGDVAQSGTVAIAPGGQQIMVECRGGRCVLRLAPGGNELYKPSVDVLFGSAARSLGDGVLGVVLTGMGSDGSEGARLLKEKGSFIWSQDQASSVVFGMPYSVAKLGYSDRVLALNDIGDALARLA